MRLRTTSSVRRSCCSRSASFSRSTTSSVSSSWIFCADVEVGRIAGRVGQRAGIGDRAQERADSPVVAAQLEDFFDHGAILALELAREVGRRHLVGPLVDRDAEHAVAGRPRPRPERRGGARPVTRAALWPDSRTRFADLGDDADAGEALPLPRHQQDPCVAAGVVHRQGDGHAREKSLRRLTERV